MVENVVDKLRLGESKGPTSPVSDNGGTEEPRRGTKVLDVKTGSEGGLEVADEEAIATDEDTIIDVDGEYVKEGFMVIVKMAISKTV